MKSHQETDTRWICHKLEALKNLLDKYGLYMQHFDIIGGAIKEMDKRSVESQQC